MDYTGFTDYVINQIYSNSRFLEKMNKVIPWNEIQNWFRIIGLAIIFS